MTIRAVLDTNVVLSGLFWHGTPHALLDRLVGESAAAVARGAPTSVVDNRPGPWLIQGTILITR